MAKPLRAFEMLSLALGVLGRSPAEFSHKLARYLRPMPQPYRGRFRMSLRRWLLYHHERIVFEECRWMGVRALKNPLDCWIYQEILYEVRPDVLVELGSAEGGSTLFFAHLMDILGKGIVVSVDLDRSRFSVAHERIRQVTGATQAKSTLSSVQGFCQGKTVMLVHDADHRRQAVLDDLRAYSSLVTPGSYLIVEDGIVDLYRPGDGLGYIEEGPLAAIDDFLQEHPGFEVDATRERYLVTYNPRGFLRRIR